MAAGGETPETGTQILRRKDDWQSRILTGVILASVAGGGGGIWSGVSGVKDEVHETKSKIDETKGKIDEIANKLSRLEENRQTSDKRFDRIETIIEKNQAASERRTDGMVIQIAEAVSKVHDLELKVAEMKAKGDK